MTSGLEIEIAHSGFGAS